MTEFILLIITHLSKIKKQKKLNNKDSKPEEVY